MENTSAPHRRRRRRRRPLDKCSADDHMFPLASKQDDTGFEKETVCTIWDMFTVSRHACLNPHQIHLSPISFFCFLQCWSSFSRRLFFPFIYFLFLISRKPAGLRWRVHGNVCVCVCVFVCVSLCFSVCVSKALLLTVVSQRVPKSGWPQLLTTPHSLHALTLSSAA